jgi:AcrR family transcriptional regulator
MKPELTNRLDTATMSSEKPLRKPRARRPLLDTRERILQTAVKEFAAKGYSGARIETIARLAKANIRMIYHYFGSKEALYVGVLEHVLSKLRKEELQLDVGKVQPLDGIMQIFDFIDGHFSAHPELWSLLSSENLNRAAYMKKSARIPEMSSPVIEVLHKLLVRGAACGDLRPGIDPLHLYVTLVSLACFHKSNAYTLSQIFRHNLRDPDWQRAHKRQAHHMLLSYLDARARSSSAALSLLKSMELIDQLNPALL